MTHAELMKNLSDLEKLSKQFPAESEEAKAILNAAEAMIYVSHVDTSAAYVKFLADRDHLSVEQVLYLRAMGLEPRATAEVALSAYIAP